MDQSNPFLVPSDLPFAFPPFDVIRHEHYRPAFDAGVAEQRAEVEAIATQDTRADVREHRRGRWSGPARPTSG